MGYISDDLKEYTECDNGIGFEPEEGSTDDNTMTQDENEAYQSYLERLSAPPCPVKLTTEQIEELRSQGYHV
jgi:hypothetical protein